MGVRHFYALYCYCGQKAIHVFTNYGERYAFVTRTKFTSQITAGSARKLMKQGVQVATQNKRTVLQ